MAVPVNINQSLSMARTSLQPATQDTRVLLLVEDNPGDAQLVSELLSEQQRERFQIIHVPAVAAAVHTLLAPTEN
jgi:hypothetical protein